MVVDTSALMAIVLSEPDAERCIAVLEGRSEVMISAGALAEALIVADRRSIAGEMTALVACLGIEIVSVSGVGSTRVAEAYARFGKGVHAASLNFGDCFAYALADELGPPAFSATTSPRPTSRPHRRRRPSAGRVRETLALASDLVGRRTCPLEVC